MDIIRRLVIVRHAGAESFATSDLDRALTASGSADARALGAWLAADEIVPAAAYVSHATRTRQTWAQIAAAAGWALDPQIEGGLYSTDEEGVLDLVRGTPEGIDTIVVVGHNPTMEMLVQSLDDGEGPATGAVERGTFPTCTAAVFEVSGTWADIAPMGARLSAFHISRNED